MAKPTCKKPGEPLLLVLSCGRPTAAQRLVELHDGRQYVGIRRGDAVFGRKPRAVGVEHLLEVDGALPATAFSGSQILNAEDIAALELALKQDEPEEEA